MRRSLALLALVSISWSYVAALQCAVGAERGHADASHHQPGSTHGGATGLDAPSSPVAPAGPSCGILMTCGTAMTEASATSSGFELHPPWAATRHGSSGVASADALMADPPPPRHLV